MMDRTGKEFAGTPCEDCCKETDALKQFPKKELEVDEKVNTVDFECRRDAKLEEDDEAEVMLKSVEVPLKKSTKESLREPSKEVLLHSKKDLKEQESKEDLQQQLCTDCERERSSSTSSNQTTSSTGSGNCSCCLIRQRNQTKASKDTPEKLYGQIILLSVSFFFMFCAYNGLESLQSSLNVSIGQASVGIIYAMLIICSLTVAPICVGRWQPKICICVSWFCYISFTLANMYPVWWTMFSSAILLGFGASLVWIAQGVYITSLAEKYAELTGQNYVAVLSKFNGIFFMIYASTLIFGNLISSLLFHHSQQVQKKINESAIAWSDLLPSSASNSSDNDQNVTLILEGDQVCGAQNCPYLQAHQVYSRPPDASLVQMLFYIFLTCNTIGLVTACFLTNLDSRGPVTNTLQVKKNLKEVFFLIKDPNLLLLIVPLISIRFFQSMSISAYNQAFVTCSLGIGMVGYVMISRATFYMIASYISGRTGQTFHRGTHFAAAMVLYVIVALMWLLWTPNKRQLWMFFIIPSLEGLGSGLWRVQVSVILGWLFSNKKEAAFAHHNAWLGLGSCIVFSSGSFFCFSTKTFFILAVIALSTVSYSGLELKIHRAANASDCDNNQC